MDLSKHCNLCDNQKVDFKKGTTCALTNRKPEFNNTCAKIELNEKFEGKVKDVNIRYQKANRAKAVTYSYFIIFAIIGISVIVGGFLLGKYIFEGGVISAIPIIIMAVGLGPIGMAFGALNNHHNELKIAKSQKNMVDDVLNLYRINYDINIKFGKEYHGNQDVYVDLQTKGIR